MLPLYLFTLVFGGVLLGVSIFFGDAHDGPDDLDVDPHADADAGHGTVDGLVSTLASLRFWTFFTAFFGATGALLTHFGLASTALALVASLAMGGGIGFAVARLFRYLQSSQTNSFASASRFVGMTATVLVSVSKDKVGRIRLLTAAGVHEMSATTPSEELYAEGIEVHVLAIADGKAVVARADLGVDEEVELVAAASEESR